MSDSTSGAIETKGGTEMSLPRVPIARSSEAARGQDLAIAALVGHWSDTPMHDPGITLVELFAYLADVLTYYQDRTAAESYLQTDRSRDGSTVRISVRDARPASCLVADDRNAYLVLVGAETRDVKVAFARGKSGEPSVSVAYGESKREGHLTIRGLKLQERFVVIVVTDPRTGSPPFFRVWPPR
jgi:hypothetical protein